MSLILDTCVLIKAEKAQKLDLSRWSEHKLVFISAFTVSELLVGAEVANTPERKIRRTAFIEYLLNTFPVLSFDVPIARTHARMLAALKKGVSASVLDGLIAATAMHGGHSVLTQNVKDFKIFSGLEVLEWTAL